MQIAKLGYAGFNTPNVEAMLAYYTNVIGFTLVERGGDGSAYLRSVLDHHTLALYPAQENGLRHIGFQIGAGQTLKEAAEQLREQGITVETQSDAQPGIAEQLQFKDPSDTTIHLYETMEQVHDNFPEAGIVPEKLGHVALAVHDVQKSADFYQNVLGFRVSDWIEDFFVFMRCGPDHHTMNFLRTKYRKMHHIAFQLKDWAHVQRACDHLYKHNIPLVWGPGRHGVGHNIFTYHHDPDGQTVELFTELDIMLNEDLGYFEPRPWHGEFPQKPKVWKADLYATNHWGAMPPPEILE
ncbi:3,4-dihydroxyphenylacetate 2,3-dioxygenase [Reticulibacter mediterranei]|jgi:catechol-2,3-dioxygenase|uniref:3,4-dihydroxyphenylacetate 2,3-dioxygenase n=1 Tax=Reticulibacter mediterranei TaxID=2778369 RepID=A0A8J3IS15_9CHLR|nr:VOC family protein [Reticulibacter mediterranei]GHO97558.1 3,4-dihydroxyphenylacetate 2,3-dioxygenase [Reticulibacter mediterranei]